jgi:hypothetical protein
MELSPSFDGTRACTCPFLLFLVIFALSVFFLFKRYHSTMVPRRVYELCHQPETVTSELARDPSQCPTELFLELFEGHHLPHIYKHRTDSSSDAASDYEKLDDLQKARVCGNFGSAEPSNLFLQVFFLDHFTS